MNIKKYKRLGICVLISLFCVSLGELVQFNGWFDHLELKTFDLRVQFRTAQSRGHRDVVILLIDEASLKSMKSLIGRWPWPRSLFADLNDFLTEYNAAAVLYDILFTEPQVPRDHSGNLGQDDSALVQSSTDSGHIVFATQLLHEQQQDKNSGSTGPSLPKSFSQRFRLNVSGNKKLFYSNNNNYYLPLRELYENGGSIGVVEFAPDADGVFRRTRLLRSYQRELFPVLSLAALLHQNPERQLSVRNQALLVGTQPVPLLENGDYLVNPKKEFVSLSIGGVFSTMQQIRQGNFENLIINPELFENKIVLIGASAVGVEDLKPIAYGPNYPGVYLHASIISNILDHDYIRQVPHTADILLTCILTFLIALLITSRTKIFLKGIIPVLLVSIYIYTGFIIFDRERLWLSLVYPLSGILLAYLTSFIYMTFTEGSERLKTKRMFSQFVSPSVLSEVMEHRSELSAEVGVKQELTILFSDIRGFTSMSERMSPEQVVGLLNHYLHEMVELVFKYNGTLDKFIGDAVMAFWGAPVKDDEHAVNAVLCALEMQQKVVTINREFREQGMPEIKIGIGTNTGPVIVGNIGSDKRLDYTVIGDNVNISSRIEGLTKVYQTPILISEYTYCKLDKDRVSCRIIDKVRVKGKKNPIFIYEPLAGPTSDPDVKKEAEWLAAHSSRAFFAYQERNWGSAESAYQEILERRPNDWVSRHLIDRCRENRDAPPPADWDGCYNFQIK